jgi:hypothetical protein
LVKHVVITFAISALLALAAPLLGQKQSSQTPHIRMWAPWRPSLVSVDLWLYSADDPLFVPYCGMDEENEMHLCSLATHLEKKTSHGWREAELRNATKTGKGLQFASGVLIRARSRDSFTFTFSTDAYGIPSGTRLRVVVDAWPNQDRMRSGTPPTQVTSPEFVCPP